MVLRLTLGDTEVGKYTFCKLACLHTVVMPASIERVESGAFACCKGVVTIEFVEGGNLKVIGHSAFHECKGLQYVSIPQGTTAVHTGAFGRCTNLRTVELPASLASPLGSEDPNDAWPAGGVFSNCALLNEVRIVSGAGPTALIPILGSPHHNAGTRSSFHGCPDATVVVPITVRTLAGDEYPLDGLQLPA